MRLLKLRAQLVAFALGRLGARVRLVNAALLILVGVVFHRQAVTALVALLARGDIELIQVVDRLLGNVAQKLGKTRLLQLGFRHVGQPQLLQRTGRPAKRAHHLGKPLVGVQGVHVVDEAVDRPVLIGDAQLVVNALGFQETLQIPKRAQEIERVLVLCRHGVGARAFAMVDEHVGQKRQALGTYQRGRREHQILGQAHVLGEAQVVLAHERHAQKLVPRQILEGTEDPVGVIAPAAYLGVLVGQKRPERGNGHAYALIEQAMRQSDDIGLRLLGAGKRALDELGLAPIVAVEEVQVLALRGVHACVTRGGGTGVFLRDDAHAGIGRGKLFHDGDGAVGRAIIDADELDVAIRLRKKALQTLAHMLLAVVHGHDDGHQRTGGHRIGPRRLLCRDNRLLISHVPVPSSPPARPCTRRAPSKARFPI